MSGAHDPALVVAATLGTGRRAASWPGALPARPRAEADESIRLLDALALGAALGRAGRVGATAEAPPVAAADPRPAAPARAAGLLDLHLTQSPVGTDRTDDLLRHWLHTCGARGYRLPHAALPAVLRVATVRSSLQTPARAVAGTRGRWLAAQAPEWAWVEEEAQPAGDWAHLGRAERHALLGRTRAADPAAGRALLESTWAADPAPQRLDHLRALTVGLGPDDEPLLESALDDRAANVRDAAATLLDRLPTSRRAARMAARLRPLITVRGLLRKTMSVELPDDPDDAGVRDGLGAAPGRTSKRAYWLERIAMGAPLSVWTESGLSIAAAARLLPPDAQHGVTLAAHRRRDAAWAEALLDAGGRDLLLGVLPREEAERRALAQIRGGKAVPGTIVPLPRPWSRAFSDQVAQAIRRSPAFAQTMAHHLDGIDPGALHTLGDWVAAAEPGDRAARHVRARIQYHAALTTIDEAFA